MERLIEVSISSYSRDFEVKCGDTTRSFANPDWQTAGFIVGFAQWCRANEWAVAKAFEGCCEKEVRERMMGYVTEAMEKKSTGLCDCCGSHNVRLSDDTVIVNNNPYYRLLDHLIVTRPEADKDKDVWGELVREELKRNREQ